MANFPDADADLQTVPFLIYNIHKINENSVVMPLLMFFLYAGQINWRLGEEVALLGLLGVKIFMCVMSWLFLALLLYG